jgi:hypothetical protein
LRIAITADLHLTPKVEHPERLETLQEILRQCGKLSVDWLVIAGDLFDRSQRNFAEFEKAYREARPEGLAVTVIPGNHDAEIGPGSLSAEGLELLGEPTLRIVDDDLDLLFVPYVAGTSMGEHLPAFRGQLRPGHWALISHGDWAAGRRATDPNEPGIYMPLTRSDLETYRPAIALLGHVHAPIDDPPIHYAGSPCPLEINETGLRRFLLFDSTTGDLNSQPIDSPLLYFTETIVMVPVEDEPKYIKQEIAHRIEHWAAPKRLRDRIRARLRIVGYASDRQAVEAAAREAMKGIAFYDQGPDLSELNQAADADRIHIARQVRQWIEELDWGGSQNPAAEPTAEEIALEALRVIWGE